MLDFGNLTFLGNSILAWMISLVVALSSMLALLAVQRFVRKRFLTSGSNQGTLIRKLVVSVLDKVGILVLLAISLIAASLVLELGDTASTIGKRAIALVLLIQIGLWITVVFSVLLDHYLISTEDSSKRSAVGLINFVGRTIIWSLILLVALDNLGVDITGFIAGLGIGGVAVALALQNILSDLFSSLSIVLDKPFEVGDFVVSGEIQGSVERIGIKTTRIRSISGEQIVLSNSDLLGSRIRNYKRMLERRIVFSFGVTYDTPYETLKSIPEWVKQIVEEEGQARFDRAHFKGFGDSSLDYEVVYFVLVPDYLNYMDTQQNINLGLVKTFEEKKVEFAFPTRTLHVASMPAASNK